jgi:uncharacterized protein YgiM (DUF1202 family)
MPRASFAAALALFLVGASTMACTAETDGPSGGGSSGTVSSRKREPSAASGEIEGAPQTPGAGTADDTDGNDDGNEGDNAAPPPSSNPDPGTTPTPPPADPDPADPDPIPNGSFAAGTELVTTANLNVRDGADTSYPILVTVPKGSRVMVATVSGASGWVNVSFQGSVGWSSKSYLALP